MEDSIKIFDNKSKRQAIPKFIRKADKRIPQDEDFDLKGFARVGHYIVWYGRHLSSAAHRVYAAMKCVAPPDRTTHGYTDYDGRPIAKVSYDELANITTLGRTTVIRAVAELIHFGWIKKLESETDNIKEKNRYDVSSSIFPITVDRNTEEKQPRTCPTKEEAATWKRQHSRRRSNGFGVATATATIELDEDYDQIPF